MHAGNSAFFFFSSRRRHTSCGRDWSSDVCSSDLGITTLFVTHDQEEALAIADRVGVMQLGRLEQLGPPTLVYTRPATPFVAEFVGLTNRLAGTVKGGSVEVRGVQLPLVQPDIADGPATALVRPEAVTLIGRGDAEEGPLVRSEERRVGKG